MVPLTWYDTLLRKWYIWKEKYWYNFTVWCETETGQIGQHYHVWFKSNAKTKGLRLAAKAAREDLTWINAVVSKGTRFPF